MSNGNAPTLQSVYSCEENCRQTYTDWIAVSPETTETGVADLFYTVLFNGQEYVFLLPLPDQGEVEDEVYIFRVIEGDTMADEDFEIVEDENLAEELYDIFTERNKDRFTVEKG